MARLEDNGVPYFPLVTVWDRKIKLIEAKYKLEGAGCIVALMQAIYNEGYAMIWDDEAELLFSSEKGITLERLREIVDFAVAKEIFDRNMLEQHHVLTSHGIQKQWLAIVKSAHRKVTRIASEVCLLTDTELGIVPVPSKASDRSEKSGESAPIGAESTEDSTQSKVNQSTERDAPAREEQTSKGEEEDVKVLAQRVADFWIEQYHQATGIPIAPNPITFRSAANMVRTAGMHADVVIKAIQYYFEHWREFWFACSRDSWKGPTDTRRCEFSIQSLEKNLPEVFSRMASEPVRKGDWSTSSMKPEDYRISEEERKNNTGKLGAFVRSLGKRATMAAAN